MKSASNTVPLRAVLDENFNHVQPLFIDGFTDWPPARPHQEGPTMYSSHTLPSAARQFGAG
jgi:hypothetical protein